jgi:hypothetical protein
MLDGLGQKAGTTAKSRITAHMIALQAAEVLVDGESRSEPISAMVIAATIARIFRRSKKAPLPCELLAACMDTRKAVAKLLEWLQEVEHFGGHMRLELEWLIAKGQPGYDGKLDTDDRIPVFENRVTQ